jgi:hypothetical protein
MGIDARPQEETSFHYSQQQTTLFKVEYWTIMCTERETETERVWVSRTLPICFLQDKLSLWRIPLAGGGGCYEAFKQAIADTDKKNSESFDLLQLCLQLLESAPEFENCALELSTIGFGFYEFLRRSAKPP